MPGDISLDHALLVGPVVVIEPSPHLGHSWPNLHWWLSLTASDQGAWIAGLGAFAAAAVAVAISVVQFRRDAARERRIAEAVAPALVDDLHFLLAAVSLIEEKAFHLENPRLPASGEIEAALRVATDLQLPAFDRFKDQLPLLGAKVAPKVIACYATAIRTAAFLERAMARGLPREELLRMLPQLSSGAAQLKSKVQEAVRVLKPLIPPDGGK